MEGEKGKILKFERPKKPEEAPSPKKEKTLVEMHEAGEPLPDDMREGLERQLRLSVALMDRDVRARFPDIDGLSMLSLRTKIVDTAIASGMNQAAFDRDVDQKKREIRENHDDQHLMRDLNAVRKSDIVIAKSPAYYLAILDVIEERLLRALKGGPS